MKRAFLLMLCPLVLTGCDSAQGAGEGNPPAPSPYRATAVGRVESRDEARQLVAAVDGVIARVLVGRGQAVRAGQVLLEVDCAPRRAMAGASGAAARASQAAAALVIAGPRSEDIAAARAGLDGAAARLRNQQQLLDRSMALADRGFVSRRDLDARTADRDAALAEQGQAAAQLAALTSGARPQERSAALSEAQAHAAEAEAARAAAGQCQLRSPIDGQVLQVLRREGEFSGASQGTALLVVGDLSSRIVRAEIGERDLGAVAIGSAAEVWAEGSARRWRGRVVELAAVMGRRSARSLDPTDRFDRDVREAIIAFDGASPPPVVGLRLTVGFPK